MLQAIKTRISRYLTPPSTPEVVCTSDYPLNNVNRTSSSSRKRNFHSDSSPDISVDCLQTPTKRLKQDDVKKKPVLKRLSWSLSRIFAYVVKPESVGKDCLATPNDCLISPPGERNEIKAELSPERLTSLDQQSEGQSMSRFAHGHRSIDSPSTRSQSKRRVPLKQLSSVTDVLDLTVDSSGDEDDVCEVRDDSSDIIIDDSMLGRDVRTSLKQISHVDVLDLTRDDDDCDNNDSVITLNKSRQCSSSSAARGSSGVIDLASESPVTRTIGELRRVASPSSNNPAIRLDECQRYRDLLAKYTTVCLPEYSESISPVNSPVDDPTTSTSEDRRSASPVQNLSPIFPKKAVSSIYRRQSATSVFDQSNSISSRRLYRDILSESKFELPDCTITDHRRTLRSDSSPIVSKPPTIARHLSTSAAADALLSDDWLHKWKSALDPVQLERERQISIEERKVKLLQEKQIAALEKLRKENEKKKEQEFSPLTDGMMAVVKRALGRGSPSEKFVSAFNADITRNDLFTLKPSTWLNDEIVNFFFNLIKERSELTTGLPQVHVFNTFFYPKVMKMGHAGVKRWTKKVDVLSVDLILIPVHLGMHWCLVAIDFTKKKISYYDSLKGNNKQCLDALKTYLNDESLEKRKEPFDSSGWIYEMPKKIPQQLNGCDCGVFMCKYAEYLGRGADFTFEQKHMPYFRQRMVYEIINKKLL